MPNPGPTNIAVARSKFLARTSAAFAEMTPISCGSSTQVASGNRPASVPCKGAGTAIVTRPAPTRYAASPARSAAPV
jgi:hypothetical protein